MHGEPFATLGGEFLRVMWHAVNLDSSPVVRYTKRDKHNQVFGLKLLFLSGSPINASSPLYAGYGSGPVFLHYTDCSGRESALSNCSVIQYSNRYYRSTSCNHFKDLTLNCTSNLCLLGCTFLGLIV